MNTVCIKGETYCIKDNILYSETKEKVGRVISKDNYRFIKDIDKKMEQFEKLKIINESQPEQRTKRWYEVRQRMITASDGASAVNENPYSNCTELILKKCGYGQPFTGNIATRWGQKYEPVATMIYEKRYNISICEFGLMPHPTISFIGASPDGITKFGTMLEIKCPFRRKITGIPTRYYWIQMQLQLECCDLEECDFLECTFMQYPDETDFKKDQLEDTELMIRKDKNEKGMIMQTIDSLDKTGYIYPPIDMTQEETEDYCYTELDKLPMNVFFNQWIYWGLKVYSCVIVERDTEWFKEKLPEYKKVWDKILYHREAGVDDLIDSDTEDPCLIDLDDNIN
jgi:putative phage-type endonuclease